MRKILSIILATVMLLSVGSTAHATTFSEDTTMQQIDDLISMAGKAARDGNIDLANKYEEEIKALGTEVLTVDEVRALAGELSGGISGIMPQDITSPPNSSAVHFYKTTTQSYYYSGTSYDIITIRAVSWDDTSAWLHTDGTIKTSSPSVYSIASGSGTVIVKTALSSLSSTASTLLTIADIFSAIGESISNYKTVSIATGDGVCIYAVDMEVKFQWISPHGQDDYILRVREGKYSEVNYSISLLTTMTKTNGSTKTYTVSKDFEKSFTPSNYGSLSRVCAAYENGSIAEYSPGSISFTIGSKVTSIPALTIPPYMDSL